MNADPMEDFSQWMEQTERERPYLLEMCSILELVERWQIERALSERLQLTLFQAQEGAEP